MSTKETADWTILMICLPGHVAEPAGIAVLDRNTDSLFLKLKPASSDWPDELRLVWENTASELHGRSHERGAEAVLSWLEDTMSHVIQVTNRRSLHAENIGEALERLYRDNVIE